MLLAVFGNLNAGLRTIEVENRARDLFDRNDKIRQPGCNGTLRHSVEFGIVWVLNNNQTALCLDIFDAERAIRTCSRQDHGDGMSVVRARKSTKEMVYRRSLTAPFLEFRKSQVGIDRVEVGVRRNDVNVVG